jgi:N-succinyldiaminopimelate aminotransferase
VLNPRLKQLPDHTWDQLRALLDPLPAGRPDPLSLTIGAPQHPMPGFVLDILDQERAGYSKYPPILGTPAWQDAVIGWLNRRYGLTDLDPAQHLLPVSGTREGLFNAAFIAIPKTKAGQQPAVLMPNPFYQTYAAAAVSAGAEAIYVSATPENNFMPDFTALPEETLARTAMIFLCTPANPQGTVASKGYIKALITCARDHDITLVADECYGEIYTGAPPVGVLEGAQEMAQETAQGSATQNPYANILSFHSLSKRSNLPGLRSGLVVGDPDLIAAYRELRSYGGATSPLPVFAAAAAAWNDDAHVQENRDLYSAKFDLADAILGNRFEYFRPEGGFFLWLDVGDGVRAATHLWQSAGVRVLPGQYLARTEESGYNPGAAYIRVALVQSPEATQEALSLISENL